MNLLLLFVLLQILMSTVDCDYYLVDFHPNYEIRASEQIICELTVMNNEPAMQVSLIAQNGSYILSLLFHVKDLHSPLKLRTYLDEFLCLRPSLCRVSQRINVENLLALAFRNYIIAFDAEPYFELHALHIHSFEFQAITEKRTWQITESDLDLRETALVKVFSVAFYFPLLFVADTESLAHVLETFLNYLQQLKPELLEMSHFFHLYLIYSLEVKIENNGDLPYILSVCETYKNSFNTIFSSSNIKLLHNWYFVPADHFQSTDYRGFLVKSFPESIRVHFYMFLTWDVVNLGSYWLLKLINHLLSFGFIQSFELIEMQSSSVETTPLPPLSLQANARILGLTEFGLHILEPLSVFLPFFPEWLNNALLIDTYSTFSSYHVVKQRAHAAQLTTPFQSPPSNNLSLNEIYLEDFIDQLHYLRRKVLLSLSSEYHFEGIPYSAEDISFQKDDSLYDSYCQLAIGCLCFNDSSNSSLSGSMMIESIPSDVVLLGRLHSMIHVKGYPPPLSSANKKKFQRKSPSSIYLNKLHYQELEIYQRRLSSFQFPKAKVAVITAVFGGYETSCKNFAKQRIATDFYCFTDNPLIKGNQWFVDTIPYYLLELINEFESNHFSNYLNLYHHNQHPFNLAKFYKQQFLRVPYLQDYEVIIWIDGALVIRNYQLSSMITAMFQERRNKSVATGSVSEPTIIYEHGRNGRLENEYRISFQSKYTDPKWLGIDQPIQRIEEQYQFYIQDGYQDQYWTEVRQQKGWIDRNEYGVFCTCFIAFDLLNPVTTELLHLWSTANQRYSTQDQISFSYASQKINAPPYPLPNDGVYGNYLTNNIFAKVTHG